MNVVVDANIIFAVLIREGFTSHLLFSERFHLFTPEYVFTEFEKYTQSD